MKEIRFRAWNGETMNYNIIVGKFGAFWINPGIKNNGLNENDSASLTPFNTKCLDSTNIMQFTGLKDRNGQDIYEGDIVKRYSEDNSESYKLGELMYMAPVVYDNSTCAFIMKCGFHFIIEEEYDLEIIGNIYENPDILSN